MSFLIETTGRRLATLPRVIPRTFAVAPRSFATTVPAQKSATETVKDGLKTVDRKVSDKLVDGIDAGANVAEKVKQAVPNTMGEAKGKAEELKGEAKGKVNELSGQAKGKAEELKGEAAGKTKGAADQVKGTADQVKKNL
ncbi:hypothetical protein CTA2_810 [Colletotrichum tanaceti]|uniref:Lea domain-containing protein n=1 Tax=Colletotrichum tanaceti TaxID=1306861 RepID=A0A4U6X9J8_9PEZI|nr:hypothetical protein CTA2_810 [Colletotrichum tanaceti]TKW52298.1 hypothetical protein CTA1_3099 [Colletotrichum tanaceti]